MYYEWHRLEILLPKILERSMFSPLCTILILHKQLLEVLSVLIALLASSCCSDITTWNFCLDHTLSTFVFTLNYDR